MNIKYLVKDGSGDQYVPIYPFHQETYEQAGGGPGSGSLVNKKLRIAVTINIADESVPYILLNYNYYAFISEIEVQGERHTFPITSQAPFKWQFDKPGEYTFYVTLRQGLPNNVGSPVFYSIQNQITSISLPYGIETLPSYIFQGINMPNVDIILPSSVKYLGAGDRQFSGCNLHKLVIPKNCIVNGGTLSGCAPEILEFHGTFIDAETVPFGTSSIGIDTSYLKKLIIDCRNTKIASSYNMSACEEIEVSGNVETILGGCFGGCSQVKKITLSGNKLKEIQPSAFSGCSSLVDISIADSVEDIQPGVFGGCISLKYIKLPNSLKVLKSGVLNGNGMPLETVVLPEGLEEIQGAAFSGIGTLKNVNIPSTITTIPDGCFSGCSNLKQVEIPNSISRIGSSAFGGAGLTEIIIPTSVKFIGSSAFGGCPATKVYIPNTLETLQSGAFNLYNANYSNNTLTELYVDTDLVAGTNFTGGAATTNLLFPAIFGNVNYSALKRVELGPHVTRIGDYAFYYSDRNDREIIFGDSVKEIGKYAFAYASLANELDLSHVEHIENRAFMQANFKYKDVILHNIKSIGARAFSMVAYINTLEISTEDKTLTESDIDITNDAFTDCGIYDKLIVDIPVALNESSFLYNIVLQNRNNYLKYKTLYLGDLVYNQVQSSSFSVTSPRTIESAYFGKNIEEILQGMFSGNINLKIVKLHAKKIGLAAFTNCSNLESIEGLDSVCYFASGCFAGCIKLNLGHITIPSAQDGGYVSSNAFDYTKIISLTNNYEYVNTNQYGFVYSCSDLVTVVNNATTGGTTAEILGYGRTQYNTSLKQVVTNDKSLAYLSNFPALETIVMSNPEVTFNLGNGSVFNSSPNLKDIYIYNKTAPELGGMTFSGCAENVKVHVPANATGYEAWVDGSTEWYYPYKLHWEIVKDLPAQE